MHRTLRGIILFADLRRSIMPAPKDPAKRAEWIAKLTGKKYPNRKKPPPKSPHGQSILLFVTMSLTVLHFASLAILHTIAYLGNDYAVDPV
jgi:hypothetical protein